MENPCRSSPTCSIHRRSCWPGFKKTPRDIPTPAGVPVRMTSPGCKVTRAESSSICSAIEKIMCLVLESCINSPSTHSFRSSACGSAMNRAGVIQGPMGSAPSKPLCETQSNRNGESERRPLEPRSPAPRDRWQPCSPQHGQVPRRHALSTLCVRLPPRAQPPSRPSSNSREAAVSLRVQSPRYARSCQRTRAVRPPSWRSAL